MAIFAVAGSYIGGSAAEGWEFNPGNWAWDGDTWKGIGLGAVIGAAGGIGFGYGAPALAQTGFFGQYVGGRRLTLDFHIYYWNNFHKINGELFKRTFLIIP
jgi:hypothetical protein